MENPVKEAPGLVHIMCEAPPAQQQAAILKYFTPDASLRHFVCRVPHFEKLNVPFLGEVNSRWVIQQVYLWYKTISPTVRVEIYSTVYEPKTQIVYVNMAQNFSLFFQRPFGYIPKIPLVCELHLCHDAATDRYHICSQEDHYQPNEFVKFAFPGAHFIVEWLQGLGALFCVIGALFLTPWLRALIWLSGMKID